MTKLGRLVNDGKINNLEAGSQIQLSFFGRRKAVASPGFKSLK